MAATITIADVRGFYPNSLPDSLVQIYIDTVAQADACLDSNGISEPQQKLVKLYAVAHLITMQTGGAVKSEGDMDGESVTFKESRGDSTFIDQLRGMSGYKCLQPFIDKPRRYAAILNAGC